LTLSLQGFGELAADREDVALDGADIDGLHRDLLVAEGAPELQRDPLQLASSHVMRRTWFAG
jgi:hypothetical protein